MRRSVERVARELTWSDDPFGDGVRAADYDCVRNRIHYLTVVYTSREVDLSQHSECSREDGNSRGGVEASDLTESRHGDVPLRTVGSGGRRLTAK